MILNNAFDIDSAGLYLSSPDQGSLEDSHSCLGPHTLRSSDRESHTQLEKQRSE